MGPGGESGKACEELWERRCKCACDRFLKSGVTLCLILSISLVVYSALTRPVGSRWWIWSATPRTRTLRNEGGATRVSHIVFGLAGSGATWQKRRHYSELWWSPNSTRGFVWLDESPSENYTWPVPYRVSKLERTASDRIARILKGSFDALGEGGGGGGGGGGEVRWFVMGDDDTVFFKENLAVVLGRYDHREMWYIGEVSESVEQNEMHSYRTAFGGGGFAISYALASSLVIIMDACLQTYSTFYGSDEKVSACVGDLGVPLTRESGFHQMDIRDDPYGLLAAHPVTPLVSLHHLDYIKPLFPHHNQLDSLKILQQAYKLDPARIMQQSICYNRAQKWSVSVSWGYTIQLYPSLIPFRELQLPLQTFRTWRSWSDGPFVFNTRPINPRPCEFPIVYFLDRVVETRGGNNTLATFKRTPQDAKVCNQSAYKFAMSVEKITVAAPKMSPHNWIKAPRRQCCETRSSWSLKRNMQIAIRSCKLGETITA